MWVLSEILESVCVLPQLLLLRQTTVPTVIDSFYLVTLGAYRGLYCLNWFIRGIEQDKPDAVSVIFGIIQTALYVDFAWVYYTRQRVKLRGGGIVDADDIRRGWLLRGIFGNKRYQVADSDEENAFGEDAGGNGRRRSRPNWGSRGISVSADEGILDVESQRPAISEDLNAGLDPDAKMRDPDELAEALEDVDDDAPLESASGAEVNGTPSGIGSGDEWRE